MKNILILISLIFVNTYFGQTNLSEEVSESLKSVDKSVFDSIAKSLNNKGGDRIRVLTTFAVNEEGNIVNAKARSVHPIFEQEALKVLNMVPKMTPPIKNGKKLA